MPNHGVFVENRLRAFLKTHDADVKVVAPAPWFPLKSEVFGQYGRWARVPQRETRHGIEIYHPRYFIPPKAAMHWAPSALAVCLKKVIKALLQNGWDFDFIDAHYFYPDGVAAAQVAHALEKPLVITARGSDIAQLPTFAGPRAKIIDAANRADAIITVSDGLKESLVNLGASVGKLETLRNGVDLDAFKPLDREHIRGDMNLDGPVIASVGHLIDRKGHDIVIKALKDIPHATLLIIGEGPQHKVLKALAKTMGVADQVRFLGALPHEELKDIYNAADVLALASSREGWPNVLLEAMACGTPCVATFAAGGEVISGLSAGRVVDERTPAAFASAFSSVLEHPRDRAMTRRYAENYSWDETVARMSAIFTGLTQRRRANMAVESKPLKMAGAENPKLIVTVDTEEAFDWEDFNNTAHSVCDPNDIARFQDSCASLGIAPLYFLTCPLLKDEKTCAYFRTLFDRNQADGGLHLHQWITPPAADFSGEYFSFQKNLPRSLYAEKLEALAEAYETAFGERAIAHRAGRYGVGRADYSLLAQAGVTMDFSPSVAFDFSSAGGPDFYGYANTPFAVDSKNGTVHVMPVSGAQAIRGTRQFLGRTHYTPGFAPPARQRLASFTKPMRLSPEGASLKDLQALTRRLIADETPIITFTLHSTSLTPGANPYARTQEDVEKMLRTTKDYLTWFQHDIKGECVSLHGLVHLYGNSASGT